MNVSVKLTVASNMDTIAPTWLRDANIDAIGNIGKRSPDLVVEVIPLVEKLSKEGPEPYTVKKAIKALECIRESLS